MEPHDPRPLDDGARWDGICTWCGGDGIDVLGSVCDCPAGTEQWDALRECEVCSLPAQRSGSHPRCAGCDEERM